MAMITTNIGGKERTKEEFENLAKKCKIYSYETYIQSISWLDNWIVQELVFLNNLEILDYYFFGPFVHLEENLYIDWLGVKGHLGGQLSWNE